MYINGVEEESETLIDNDADTCVNMTGNDGCKMDRIWNLFLFLVLVVAGYRVQPTFLR